MDFTAISRLVCTVLACQAVHITRLPAQTAPDPATKRAVAVRLTEPIHVDGRLDEPAWPTARALSDFQQKDPIEFAEPRDRTEVSFLYDDEALYVGARMYSSNPGAVPRDLTRRDQYGNSEHIVISVDPYLDRRTAYSFSVTAGGVRRDYYHAFDSESHFARDFTFDPVWEAKVAFDSLGWTAEMRIPFSQVRYNSTAVQTWGLNISRWIPQRNENLAWIVVPRTQNGFVSRFGTLTGMEGIPPSRRIEILPFVAANAKLSAQTDPANPLSASTSGEGRAGADFQMGIGPSLTLSGTINPDFGQVEADPAELNLSAFETFFPERRPFFTENRQLLEGPVSSYYYSRRIGGRPRGTAEGDFVDAPSNSTILGAAKMTGRTQSGLSVGALAALTQREFAQTYDSAQGVYGRQEIEPAAVYGVARLSQQFGADASTMGVSLAGVRRIFSSADALTERLTRTSLAGGGDWNLRFQGGRYSLRGQLGFSFIEGDSAALVRIQRTSAHYFQRPDATHGRIDSTRTRLAGLTAALRFQKQDGNLLYEIEGETTSPGFETNDQGRLSRDNRLEVSGNLRYRQTTPGPVFRRWEIGTRMNGEWNYDGDRTGSRVAVWATGQWANYIDSRITLYHAPAGWSHTATRGGPVMGTIGYLGAEFGANSNMSNPNGWRFQGEVSRASAGDRLYRLGGSLFFRPASTIGFSIDPSWSNHLNTRQYVTQLEGGLPASYRTRYIFATVDQTVLSTRFRLNYTLSPNLSIEGYAEPFASSAGYSSYGELPGARASELRSYGTDGTSIVRASDQYYRVADARTGTAFDLSASDFNEFSFRSNLVLRWEWRPGSTLFLVWQQNRRGSCSAFADRLLCPSDLTPGMAPGPGALGEAFGVPGDNFLAIKVSYWLSVK